MPIATIVYIVHNIIIAYGRALALPWAILNNYKIKLWKNYVCNFFKKPVI